MKRIMNVLKNFEGPSVKECMKILKRLLNILMENPSHHSNSSSSSSSSEDEDIKLEVTRD
ncbi:hypothetical protein CK203_043286 [Vitis vinifera]|uniref:Uncharacterized protein n=1 Tax=Vitis vinifera TaxID=29760 RepID=A0A438GY69_VITVI|nr:hypothetical protein CK203_043286 [Vitis vinifera]